MSDAVRFDGRVAVVTGAGGGMGRSYALELARRGAKVVVNDYGGTTDGRPGSIDRAQAVVDEIVAAGGNAVPNGDAVGTLQAAERIVGTALDTFGRIDILVNNAGIALPGPINGVDFAQVEEVYRINLIGPHALIRTAWGHMRDQRYGRVLNISSNAALGIGGNSAYGATKAGMIGLTLDAAQEGERHGILVNAVMPAGYSRMIDQVPDEEFVAWMRTNFQPEKVARAMLWFLSEQCTLSGRVLTTGGGRLARMTFVENRGCFDSDITPEFVADHIVEVDDMAEPLLISTQPEEMALYSECHPFDRGSGPGLANDKLA